MRKPLHLSAARAALAALALAAAPYAAGNSAEASVRSALGLDSFGQSEGGVQISADKMGYDNKRGHSTLDGHVKILFSDVTMTADHATYDQKTGAVEATGNVRLRSVAGGSWEGERIAFNAVTGEGLMGAGLMRLGAFKIKSSEEGRRDDDGVFHANALTITTCDNPEEDWHWSITGEGRYKAQEFLELRNAVPRVGGIPFFWMPYYYRDLNTHYGWRVRPGYTSKWGAYLLIGYIYPIAGTPGSGNELYGRSQVDLRSERGVGVGQELTWSTEGGIFGEATRQWGRLTLYYAYDKEDQEAEDMNWQSPYDEHRWSIGLKERIDFSPRDFISITGEKVSDSQFRDDYKENAVRASSQPLGIANYEHRETDWALSVAAMGPLDTFYAGIRRLPEVRVDLLPRPVPGIPNLYYETQNTFGYLRRQPAKYSNTFDLMYAYSPGNWAYYDVFRFDSRHVLRMPITLVNGVTLTPRAGWRGTYYSDSSDGDNLFRSLFELGATLQARLWRDYGNTRHTLIPYLDFTYVPGSQDGVNDQPYAFDRLDMEYEWRDRFRSDGLTPIHRYTGLRFGVKNLIQVRDEKTKAHFDRFDADLYGVLTLQDQDHYVRWGRYDQPGRDNFRGWPAERVKEPTGLRVIGLNGAYRPTENLTIATDFQYDPEESRLALWDLNVRYDTDPIIFYGGFLRRHHAIYDYYWDDEIQDTVLYGGFIHNISDTYAWSLFARYNLEETDLEEIGGFVQYNLDCIALRLGADYLTDYVTDDGWKHESDFRFTFSAWLRAFPHEEDEDWMDWASLADR